MVEETNKRFMLYTNPILLEFENNIRPFANSKRSMKSEKIHESRKGLELEPYKLSYNELSECSNHKLGLWQSRASMNRLEESRKIRFVFNVSIIQRTCAYI